MFLILLLLALLQNHRKLMWYFTMQCFQTLIPLHCILNKIKNFVQIRRCQILCCMVCHHGGPRYVLNIVPVLDAQHFRKFLMEIYFLVKGALQFSLLLIISRQIKKCINHWGGGGGPGRVKLESDGSYVILGHDYEHIHKNIQNNWKMDSAKNWHLQYGIHSVLRKTSFQSTKKTVKIPFD